MQADSSPAALLPLFGALNTVARQQSGSAELAANLMHTLREHLPVMTSAALYLEEGVAFCSLGHAGTGLALDLDAADDHLREAITSGKPLTVREGPATLYLIPFATSDRHPNHVLAASWPTTEADPALPVWLQTAVQIIALALPRTSIRDVLSEAESKLVEERNLLRTLIDNLPDFVFVKDRQSRILITNLAHARDVLGTTPEEAVGKSDLDFFPKQMADQYMVDEQALMAANKPLVDHEHRSQASDGTPSWHLNTKVPVHDAEGNVIGLVGIVRDITHRKVADIERDRLLEAEREQHVLAETLAEISLTLTSQSDLSGLLDEVMAFAHRLLPKIGSSSVVLLNNEALHFARWQDTVDPLHEQRLAEYLAQPVPLDRFPALQAALHSNQPLLVDDAMDDPQWLSLHDFDWLRAHLCMPMTFRGQAIGLLWVSSARPGEFTESDIVRLTPLANAAAIALENNRLLRESQEHAEHEERVNRIAVRLQEHTEVGDLLNVALQDLGQLLGARVGRIRLSSGQAAPAAGEDTPPAGPADAAAELPTAPTVTPNGNGNGHLAGPTEEGQA